MSMQPAPSPRGRMRRMAGERRREEGCGGSSGPAPAHRASSDRAYATGKWRDPLASRFTLAQRSRQLHHLCQCGSATAAALAREFLKARDEQRPLCSAEAARRLSAADRRQARLCVALAKRRGAPLAVIQIAHSRFPRMAFPRSHAAAARAIARAAAARQPRRAAGGTCRSRYPAPVPAPQGGAPARPQRADAEGWRQSAAKGTCGSAGPPRLRAWGARQHVPPLP